MSKRLTLSLAIGLLAFCASGAMPDLIIDKPLLAGSVEVQGATFGAGDCAVVEGCAAGGTRRLLRFDVGFKNIGKADLVIGDPNANPDLFESSPCHGHSHLKGAADYVLLNSSGQTVLRARKQAFCFRDSTAFSASAGPGRFTCDFQGLSAGWEDIYDKSLDCQWLDITGLPGGTYLLQVTVNPDGVFTEGNYANNTASVSITLAGKPPEQPPSGGTTPPKVKKPEPDWKKLADKFKKQKEKKKKKHKQKQKGKGKGHGHHHDGEDDDDGKKDD
jgi:hypothetical protein